MKQIQGPVNCFQTAYLLLMHMDGVCVCARAAHAACSKVVQAKRCLSDTCRLISGHKEMIVAMIMLIIAGNAVVLAFPDMYGLRSGHKEMITVTMITADTRAQEEDSGDDYRRQRGREGDEEFADDEVEVGSSGNGSVEDEANALAGDDDFGAGRRRRRLQQVKDGGVLASGDGDEDGGLERGGGRLQQGSDGPQQMLSREAMGEEGHGKGLEKGVKDALAMDNSWHGVARSRKASKSSASSWDGANGGVGGVSDGGRSSWAASSSSSSSSSSSGGGDDELSARRRRLMASGFSLGLTGKGTSKKDYTEQVGAQAWGVGSGLTGNGTSKKDYTEQVCAQIVGDGFFINVVQLGADWERNLQEGLNGGYGKFVSRCNFCHTYVCKSVEQVHSKLALNALRAIKNAKVHGCIGTQQTGSASG
eukprot:388985-Pelagomonas_calceolata.AAC.7